MHTRSFIYSIDAIVLIAVLLISMLILVYVGRRVGLKVHAGKEYGDTGTISTIFGLMAFLLAFTFGMSGSRFDTRRDNIVNEANAIGTAIILADLYPDEDRKAFREDFKSYIEERIEYFDTGHIAGKVDHGTKLWERAAKLSHKQEYYLASQQMIPVMTDMLSLNTTRLIGELSTVPDSIVWMLFILALVCAFYLGYSSGNKKYFDWFLSMGFCALICVIIYITLDLDRPRRGLIQLATSHKAMTDLRKLF